MLLTLRILLQGGNMTDHFMSYSYREGWEVSEKVFSVNTCLPCVYVFVVCVCVHVYVFCGCVLRRCEHVTFSFKKTLFWFYSFPFPNTSQILIISLLLHPVSCSFSLWLKIVQIKNKQRNKGKQNEFFFKRWSGNSFANFFSWTTRNTSMKERESKLFSPEVFPWEAVPSRTWGTWGFWMGSFECFRHYMRTEEMRMLAALMFVNSLEKKW